jgi:hypothetical protein
MTMLNVVGLRAGLPNVNVQRSVVWSFCPHNMCCPSCITLHLLLSKLTVHPALQRTQIPISEVTDNFGMMCPVNTWSNPKITLSCMHVKCTVLLSVRVIRREFDVTLYSAQGCPP